MGTIHDIGVARQKREHKLALEKMQKERDMIRAMDDLIQMAMIKGVCEHCGSFMDNPYHEEPCKLSQKITQEGA